VECHQNTPQFRHPPLNPPLHRRNPSLLPSRPPSFYVSPQLLLRPARHSVEVCEDRVRREGEVVKDREKVLRVGLELVRDIGERGGRCWLQKKDER